MTEKSLWRQGAERAISVQGGLPVVLDVAAWDGEDAVLDDVEEFPLDGPHERRTLMLQMKSLVSAPGQVTNASCKDAKRERTQAQSESALAIFTHTLVLLDPLEQALVYETTYTP